MTKLKNPTARGIILTAASILISFIFLFALVIPLRLNNMGGEHTWLSGSTLKFVNYWLDEGVVNLHFTNYDVPNSIEFTKLDDRSPYLSYPSGETFFVYMAARMLGREQISVTFLHKFQLLMFCIESILFGVFIYLFLTHTVRLKRNCVKIPVALTSAILWVLMPNCTYYLVNVYYADQSVILWVMAFILVAYSLKVVTQKRTLGVLKAFRTLLLFSGFLVDYYFWILAFCVFVLELVAMLMDATHEAQEKRKNVFKLCLAYGIPVLLAIVLYYWQLTYTNDWLNVMKQRFELRTVGKEGETAGWIFSIIYQRFVQAFSLDQKMVYYLIALLLLSGVGGVIILAKEKKLRSLIQNPGLNILCASTLAIILQIIFLKQHSAIHEFSMIKVSWLIAILPLVLTIIFLHAFAIKTTSTRQILGKRISKFLIIYGFNLLIVALVVGIPASTANYTNRRVILVDYPIEEAIHENTTYEDVVFSYTYKIVQNPPQSLAISNKLVYQISDISELETRFPNLPETAHKLLLIQNENSPIDSKGQRQENCFKTYSPIRYADDRITLLSLDNEIITKCEREI